ncbi:MAG: ParB/RepB/Spo0J family partition protein [Gammaproteobacteria bacterium]|nr:ParB/RepB/Spo0J family partition protein [Gammaproteobacteria bacterium]
MSKRRLGRGLDALLSGDAGSTPAGAAEQGELAIEEVVRGRYQPRREFAEDSLKELAASIKSQGLMQPIVVRPRPQGGYELIAGERRWRAAQMAGLTHIAAIVKQVSDEQASAMALIENIQREDLNPLEEAFALQRLRDEFGLTQQQVADAVGKSRVAVTNLLRLLNLAPAVRELLQNGTLEMGHARALLSLDAMEQERVAREVAGKHLSVRQTEALVRQRQAQPSGAARRPARQRESARDADTVRLEQDLADRIGAPVSINHGSNGRGQLVISYSTLEELEGILKHLR